MLQKFINLFRLEQTIRFNALSFLELVTFSIICVVFTAAIYSGSHVLFLMCLDYTESLFLSLCLLWSLTIGLIVILPSAYALLNWSYFSFMISLSYITCVIAEDFSYIEETARLFVYHISNCLIQIKYLESPGLWYLLCLLLCVGSFLSLLNFCIAKNKYLKHIQISFYIISVILLMWASELQITITFM
jgi:hypothetical protein